MKNIIEQKVYYADTDAYRVVWHGAYLRWMEMGRVNLCEQYGLDLITLEEQDILMPVTNMNVRYKSSAKLNDTVIIETWISRVSPLTVTFAQKIYNKETEKIFIQAEFEVVATQKSGKLYRRLPEILTNAFTKDLVCQD